MSKPNSHGAADDGAEQADELVNRRKAVARFAAYTARRCWPCSFQQARERRARPSALGQMVALSDSGGQQGRAGARPSGVADRIGASKPLVRALPPSVERNSRAATVRGSCRGSNIGEAQKATC